MNFPISFAAESIDGTGAVSDISINGCSFQTTGQLPEGTIVRIALQFSNGLEPVNVDAAVIRYVQQNRVGVEFLRFHQGERERLQLFIRRQLEGRSH
jgi:hypothetical protein